LRGGQPACSSGMPGCSLGWSLASHFCCSLRCCCLVTWQDGSVRPLLEKVDPLCSPREMYRNTAYTYRIAHCFLRVGPWICEFGRLLGRPIWLKIRNLPETNCPRQISIRNQEQSSWKGYISLKLSRAFTTRQASLPPPGSSGEPHTVRGAGRAISEECGSREGDDGDLGPGEVQQEVIRTLDS